MLPNIARRLRRVPLELEHAKPCGTHIEGATLHDEPPPATIDLLWQPDAARVAASNLTRFVGQGDRVAGWLPNVAETVIAMLATTSLGTV